MRTSSTLRSRDSNLKLSVVIPAHNEEGSVEPTVRAVADRLPVALLCLLSLVAFALILFVGRGMTFYFDEWDFVLGRTGHSADVFLKPHNEHISVVPVLVYKVLFKTVGLEHHWPYLAVLALMHVALGICVFVLARRRVGPWAALIVTALLLFMGLAWQNMVWAFQIGFVGSVLGGVAALVALDTPGRRNDILACVALVFSIVCSSLGVPLALGVGAELLALRRRRALWVALVPLVLYGIWYLGYGVSTITREGLIHAAGWAVTAAENAAGAPFGVGADWGVVLLLIVILAVGRRFAIGPPPTPRLLNLAVAGIVFWLLTGAARSVVPLLTPPSESRYLTLGAIVLLLGAVELLRGTIIPPRLLIYATGVAVICVWIGCSTLIDEGKTLRVSSESTTAALGALQLSPGPVPPGYMPDPANPQITAGPYRTAVRIYDSDPADSPDPDPRREQRCARPGRPGFHCPRRLRRAGRRGASPRRLRAEAVDRHRHHPDAPRLPGAAAAERRGGRAADRPAARPTRPRVRGRRGPDPRSPFRRCIRPVPARHRRAGRRLCPEGQARQGARPVSGTAQLVRWADRLHDRVTLTTADRIPGRAPHRLRPEPHPQADLRDPNRLGAENAAFSGRL